jgi:hypothetical protein
VKPDWCAATRADRRVVAERRAEPAAEHPVGGGLVVVVLVALRADEADLVHRLCHPRDQLADVQAGDVASGSACTSRGSPRARRLHVERVVVRDAAAEEHEQDRLAPGCGPDARTRGRGRGPGALARKPERQPEPQRPRGQVPGGRRRASGLRRLPREMSSISTPKSKAASRPRSPGRTRRDAASGAAYSPCRSGLPRANARAPGPLRSGPARRPRRYGRTCCRRSHRRTSPIERELLRVQQRPEQVL